MPSPGVLLDGSTLKRLRRQQRQTGTELADTLGIAPNYLYRLERGAGRASLTLLAKLEAHFDLDPTALELVHPDERPKFVLA